MRGFQLVAKITDEQLFRKAIHELGTILYLTENDISRKLQRNLKKKLEKTKPI